MAIALEPARWSLVTTTSPLVPSALLVNGSQISFSSENGRSVSKRKCAPPLPLAHDCSWTWTMCAAAGLRPVTSSVVTVVSRERTIDAVPVRSG